MFRRTWAAVAVAIALIVGVAVAAPAFAGSPASGPAWTQSGHPGHPHPTPSPTHTHPGYPATVPTHTKAWSTPATTNGSAKIFAAVFSGAGVPTGTVTFSVTGQSATVPLVNGAASWGVTGLSPGTHHVTVTYNPTPGSQFKPSSASTVVRIVRIHTRTRVFAPSIHVGNPAVLTAVVTARGFQQPAGIVVFAVAGRSLSAPLTNGTATVSVPGLRSGTYLVTAAFTPSDPSFAGSSGHTALRVRGFHFHGSGFGWDWGGWNSWTSQVSWRPFSWGSVWFT